MMCGCDSSPPVAVYTVTGRPQYFDQLRPSPEGSVRCPFLSLYMLTTHREIGTVHHHPPGPRAYAHAHASCPLSTPSHRLGRRRQVVVLFLRLPLLSCVVSKKLVRVTVGVNGCPVVCTITCCHPWMTWLCSDFVFGGTVVRIYYIPLVLSSQLSSCIHFYKLASIPAD